VNRQRGRCLLGEPPGDVGAEIFKRPTMSTPRSTKPPSVHTSARPRSKPLYQVRTDGEPDFLLRLEEAEARDTERLSHRSDPCSSPPPSRRPPPLPIGEAFEAKASKSSARNSARKLPLHPQPLALDAPMSAERLLSARMRSTPRPSPHPTPTPRAPRAVRTPKGTGEPLVQVRTTCPPDVPHMLLPPPLSIAQLTSLTALCCSRVSQGFPTFNTEAIRNAEVRQLALSARGDAAATSSPEL